MSDTMKLRSTSRNTAEIVDPIKLLETDRIRTIFKPSIIKNDKNPAECVSGKIIYEKKRKKDESFPSDKISRSSIKVGEQMEISLGCSETYNLLKGLQNCYKLYNDIGGIPLGSKRYTQVDRNLVEFYNLFRSNINNATVLNQFKPFFQLMTQTKSREALMSLLQKLDNSNISNLNTALNLEKLIRIRDLIADNLENSNEEFWQKLFAENQWVISQIFCTPMTIFEDKAYVGGKGVKNKGGNICDFIFKNNMTQNVALIEIKTPCTPIIKGKYRDTYNFHDEISGAINQVINYKDKIIKGFHTLINESEETFSVFNPNCVVIVGKISSLNKKEVAALENYRSNLNNIFLISYDELLRKISDLIHLLTDN